MTPDPRTEELYRLGLELERIDKERDRLVSKLCSNEKEMIEIEQQIEEIEQ